MHRQAPVSVNVPVASQLFVAVSARNVDLFLTALLLVFTMEQYHQGQMRLIDHNGLVNTWHRMSHTWFE